MTLLDPILAEELAHLPLELGQSGGVLPKTHDTAPEKFSHWRFHLDPDRLLWVLLDKQGTSTNTLSQAVLEEFERVLSLAVSLAPKALVLRSAKPGSFIAGADVSEFQTFNTPEVLQKTITQGLSLFEKFAALPFPTIAAIHGFCLGGGLELALAARFRLGRRDATFAFPEVKLGLHPGLGGTWRGFATIDPLVALEMMLSGKTLKAPEALRAGLLDALFEEYLLKQAVHQIAFNTFKKPSSFGHTFTRSLLKFSPLRTFVCRRTEKALTQKVSPRHYLAPFAMLKLFSENGLNKDPLATQETLSFARLFTTPQAENLRRCFFLRETLKAQTKSGSHGIKHVHVIGAGTMGGDIAAWAALRGFYVTVQDQTLPFIAKAIARAQKTFTKTLRKPLLVRACLDRLVPDPQGVGLKKADLVIEAIPEKLDLKLSVLEAAESGMKEGAFLATNTSSFPLETLRTVLKNPERFCGLHFFNPVAQMPLVECVTHDLLSETTQSRLLSFLGALDKVPLKVKSSPGFFVNRVLMPYMLEALLAHSEGMPAEQIDAVALAFGMPMGPLELADVVGLDVCASVASVLSQAFSETIPPLPELLEKRIKAGKLGKKTGSGIYVWKKGTVQKKPVSSRPPKDLEDRLVFSLLNTTVECLSEGVVATPDEADAGMVFGTGFAPFRGGPLAYAKTLGMLAVEETLKTLEETYGKRFKASLGWKTLF